MATTKKKFFKKSAARKATAPKKAAAPAAPTVKVKFRTEMLKTLKEDVYENNAYNFAVCSEIENGNCEQLSQIFTCREGLIGAFRSLLYENKKLSNKKISIMLWINSGNETHMKHFGAPIPYDKWVDSSVKASLKAVNCFEKRNKWLRTKAYRVNHEYGKSQRVYVFQGSRWWMTSSYLLSLFLLLLRLGRGPEMKKVASNASTATIVETIKDIAKSGKNDYLRVGAVDKWVVFLDNRRKIFKGRKTFVDNFKATDDVNGEGILKLTDNNARDEQTQKRFNDCLREAGLSVVRSTR